MMLTDLNRTEVGITLLQRQHGVNKSKKASMLNKISIILPTYNEKKGIAVLIDAIHSELNFLDHEIIVVDDNSPDDTYQFVESLGYQFVKAILRTEKRGLANSIRCGLENASGNILVVMDSDFNHRPNYLPFMIQSLSHYDCVSASRFIYGGAMFPRSRHFLSWIFNIFVRILTKGQITDNLYGFFVIKKDILIKLNFDDIFWGYGDYYIRLLYFLQKNKAEILQVPSKNGRRLSGQANNAFFKVFFRYSIETIKLSWRNR